MISVQSFSSTRSSSVVICISTVNQFQIKNHKSLHHTFGTIFSTPFVSPIFISRFSAYTERVTITNEILTDVYKLIKSVEKLFSVLN